MPDIRLLLIGDLNRLETRAIGDWQRLAENVEQTRDVDEAIERLTSGSPLPDLIVLVQTRPGQFRDDRLERLRRIAPLTRVLVLFGSWCEGELRSGPPLEGTIRVSWHQWAGRWSQDRARLEKGRCPLYGLPVTTTDDERLLDLVEESPPEGHGLIVIHAYRREMADWLSCACTRLGYATAWLQPGQPTYTSVPRAVIWDTAEFDVAEARGLRGLREKLGAVPALVLADFPRVQSYDLALSGGASVLLAKPLLLSDLWWCLDQMLDSREPALTSRPASATGATRSA